MWARLGTWTEGDFSERREEGRESRALARKREFRFWDIEVTLAIDQATADGREAVEVGDEPTAKPFPFLLVALFVATAVWVPLFVARVRMAHRTSVPAHSFQYGWIAGLDIATLPDGTNVT